MPAIVISALEGSRRCEIIEKAAAVLKSGGLVIFPTETVYGLGFRSDSRAACKRFFDIKQRDPQKPVSRHVAGLRDIFEGHYKITATQEKFIRAFLPGPVTVILTRNDGRSEGLRCPSNLTATEVLGACNFPVGASSVNISGEKPLSNGDEIGKIFADRVDLVLISDNEVQGVSSTVVDLTQNPFAILREGTSVKDIRCYISGITDKKQ